MPFTRRLGRSNLQVSALGLGTAGIGGGHWVRDLYADRPVGYGKTDDALAIAAIRRALDLGINFFDTADEYGCGHAERLLGQALGDRRDEAILCTKFGHVFDEETREVTGDCADPAYIRRACEASLRRLNTDVIDLYLLHLRDLALEQAARARDTLEGLVDEGKIRYYGWSTDDLERARLFAAGPHCTAIMHRLNIIVDAPEMLALCEEADLASLNRIPLLMGILTGKYRDGIDLPEEDIRSLWFSAPQVQDDVRRVEQMRPVLTRDGRTMAQGAIGWIWARSPRTLPMVGFKTPRQVEENARAMEYGPLSAGQMQEIAQILGRDWQD